MVDKRDPDITVVKVYAPKDEQVQVHQSRVVPCPHELPAGFYWYRNRCDVCGRPPRWVDRMLQGVVPPTAGCTPDTDTEPPDQDVPFTELGGGQGEECASERPGTGSPELAKSPHRNDDPTEKREVGEIEGYGDGEHSDIGVCGSGDTEAVGSGAGGDSGVDSIMDEHPD